MTKPIPLLLVFAIALSSCQPPPKAVADRPIDYSRELPPGTSALRKLSPDEYPDFSAAASSNLVQLGSAADRSLEYLFKPGSNHDFPVGDITHARAVSTVKAMKVLLEEEISNPANDGGKRFNNAIRSQFDVYQSVGAMDPNTGLYTGDVLFTGYFTPTYNASLTRTGPYLYPLYKKPADFVPDPGGGIARRRGADGTMVPAYTRQQIEQLHMLDGNEFAWLADRFEAYIVTIQGSARLRLDDGRIIEVGNTGTNGYPYVSPGRQMLADGVITKEQLTLTGLKNYFAAHPAAMDHYLPLNPREVFFQPRPGGPFGKLDVKITPFATVATDKTIFPRSLPVFLTAPLPTPGGGRQNLRSIMFDQDSGGAIPSAARCDIYMGVGEQAGQELNVGQLYYLAVRSPQ